MPDPLCQTWLLLAAADSDAARRDPRRDPSNNDLWGRWWSTMLFIQFSWSEGNICYLTLACRTESLHKIITGAQNTTCPHIPAVTSISYTGWEVILPPIHTFVNTTNFYTLGSRVVKVTPPSIHFLTHMLFLSPPKTDCSRGANRIAKSCPMLHKIDGSNNQGQQKLFGIFFFFISPNILYSAEIWFQRQSQKPTSMAEEVGMPGRAGFT